MTSSKICLAGSTSSKSGRTEERTSAVKEVGSIIEANNAIVDTIAGYIKTEFFIEAFHLYVDRTMPMLKSLAESVGDVSHYYCQAILSKAAETAGLLWKQVDIGNEINETVHEYEVIKLLGSIIKFSAFAPYETAIKTLQDAVTKANKLPKSLILSSLQALNIFFSSLSNKGAAVELKASFAQNIDIVRELFFDTFKAKQLALLKERLGEIPITDAELLTIYNSMESGFQSDETVFLNDVQLNIESYIKNSIVQNLKAEWEKKIGTDTPAMWSANNGLPARFVLGNIFEATDVITAVQSPEQLSSDRLSEILNILSGITPLSIIKCQELFVQETVPNRYANFNISLSSLLDFLIGKYGKLPNNWPVKPDISEFIQSQYKGTFAPQVTEKIQNTSADDLKERLLELAQDNPELGLLLWEG